MLGAIIGDIVGSVWEFRRHRPDQDRFPLFPDEAGFTDDTLMTLAVGRALLDADGDQDLAPALVARTLREFASMFRLQRGGYGGGFANWLQSATPEPYGSAGNGSAMRVSAAGWLYPTLELTEQWAAISAAITHDDPEGIAGAQATAAAIFLARTGESKDDIKRYIAGRFGYDLDETWGDVLADDPEGRKPDAVLCRRTVPEALAAFLGADGFEAAIRRAVAVGGDTDTRAAIAGSIAEAYWGVPDRLRNTPDDESWGVDPRAQVRDRLPEPLQGVLDEFTTRTTAARLVFTVAPAYAYLNAYPDTTWGGGQVTGHTADGKDIRQWPYPVYGPELLGMIDRFYVCGGVDYDYLAHTQEAGWGDGDRIPLIEASDASLLASILTWHIRGERFCDGLLASALKDGTLAAIARRAYELAGLPAPASSGTPPADFVAVAERIATEQHQDATDQAGAPYIEHPRRVAARILAWGGTDQQVAAAWLHDIVEDTGTTTDDLLAAGIPAETVAMVAAVTKRDGEPAVDYVRRIVATPGALLVKRADLSDNTDPARVAALQRLDPAKAERLKSKYADFTALLDAAASSA